MSYVFELKQFFLAVFPAIRPAEYPANETGYPARYRISRRSDIRCNPIFDIIKNRIWTLFQNTNDLPGNYYCFDDTVELVIPDATLFQVGCITGVYKIYTPVAFLQNMNEMRILTDWLDLYPLLPLIFHSHSLPL